jgi:hypothetical protein
MFFVLFVIIGGVVYFIPTFVGFRKKNFTPIALVNFFLGWTIVGWIFALIWAIVDKVPMHPTPPVLDYPQDLDLD